MPRKNTDHVVMLSTGDGFRCLHCFDKQELAMPCSLTIVSAVGKAFEKLHASCKAPKEARCAFCFSPGHASDGHVNEFCAQPWQWLASGDTGLSSTAIFAHFVPGTPQRKDFGQWSAPLDPSDFGRCYRLLSAPWASDWRKRIAEMARYPQWAKLALAWDELEALYVLELQNTNGMAPKLYERIKELRV